MTDEQQEDRLIADHPYMRIYEWPGTQRGWQERTASLYSDGGVFRPKRCEAGSFAWVAVDAAGTMLTYQYGWVQANERIQDISNNQTEMQGMLRALEAMPDGWRGRMCSDSGITIGRFSAGWKLLNIPEGWVRRMHAVRARLSLEADDFVLHKGHPTKPDLARGWGVRKEGGRVYPVSVHQELCDTLCGKALRLWSKHSGIQR